MNKLPLLPGQDMPGPHPLEQYNSAENSDTRTLVCFDTPSPPVAVGGPAERRHIPELADLPSTVEPPGYRIWDLLAGKREREGGCAAAKWLPGLQQALTLLLPPRSCVAVPAAQ